MLELNKIHQMDCLEGVEERVCWLLAKYEKSRNSDHYLFGVYWKYFDGWCGLFCEPYIYKITPSNALERARRYIQHDLGFWLPTDTDVREKRRFKEEIMKEWYSRERRIGIYA